MSFVHTSGLIVIFDICTLSMQCFVMHTA